MTSLASKTPLSTHLTKHQDFISSQTVGHLIEDVKPESQRQLVDLPLTSTMEEAFDLFLAEDILSAPVYTIENSQKRYLAIVSVLDLLKLLGSHISLETLKDNQVILQRPLKDAIGLTEESAKLVTVKHTDPLAYLIRLFSTHGVHRVLVQGQGSPVLLSQMDVLRYLQNNNHRLGSILDISTATLVKLSLELRQISENNVISTDCRVTALKAFLEIANNPHISALAVVENDKTLVAEISPQDLRGLNKDRFDALAKPVLMYIKASRGELYPPFTCHDRFTLSHIMAAVVLRKAPRLWWCDDEGHLKGLITLTDILGVFLKDV
ncbi:hypothetical protein J3Q64DRAFT_1696821 [Phycomyces blakesleeanus]|uniref:CBS domain-containing protein n=2 Tax=Phycomyces blakesleeanus TaxID=4837 RepID=A0A167NKD1_PHYB8|nr:hypothetical protein PHYBLDRAFT_59666 [Phycomyces blakesleeanus NRRL 1555(-)]OAD76134.1 hypothetical protein PHYBLDRAFT_59666 [Phycomyces blakesleeanus NRRL 1555(-)]|eukprot:XP_018294174.1 hypothetical protein PHYBLDRAFT_59666 [Phycomyces blakesleeanus NRRL 1555(-)]